MHEDIAGQKASGVGRRYSVCAQCGRTFLSHAIHTRESGLMEDSHSEFSEICVECERLIASGEIPLPVDDL